MVYSVKNNAPQGNIILAALLSALFVLMLMFSGCVPEQKPVLIHPPVSNLIQATKTQRECVIETYRAEIGVREATGNNDGHHVEKYLASTNLGPGYAWCAAFVNWSNRHCGVIGPQGAAWSPSWFTKEKLTHYPLPGDVFGLYYKSKGRIAHVGFVDDWSATKVRTVEGNTNDAGSREGDGVYVKYRIPKQITATANWID